MVKLNFINFGNIIISFLNGILIGLPLSYMQNFNLIPLIFSSLLGLLVGYKNRNSRLFLYFSLIINFVLSIIIVVAINNGK